MSENIIIEMNEHLNRILESCEAMKRALKVYHEELEAYRKCKDELEKIEDGVDETVAELYKGLIV